MANDEPISVAHEVRGMYAHEDEAAEYLRSGWPRFETKEACEAFVKENWRSEQSNPDRPHMTQMITTLANWAQIERYLLGARAEYDTRWPPEKGSDLTSPNRWKELEADLELQKRFKTSIHAALTPFSVENTLRYLFEHMRCGIYVMLRRNKVCIFAPFVNDQYKNHWGSRLRVTDDLDNDTYYQRKRDTQHGRHEYVLDDRHEWWANGNIICNEHSSTGAPIELSNLWGDRFIAALRDMLDTACKERTIPDCEFFINKRDYPQIKYREDDDEGEAVEPYGFLVDGDDRDPDDDVRLPREFRGVSMAPVASFYCSDRFTDLPWPPSEDWEAAIGTILPPSFEGNLEKNPTTGDMELQMDAKPRDLFTQERFEKFRCDWQAKKPTAFFRGTATGGGVDVETNQRLALASLSFEWKDKASKKDDLPQHKLHPRDVQAIRNGTDELLDAALVGWNKRDKKLGKRPMTFIDPGNFPFNADKSNFTPIYDQSKYKYLVYVEGHCAACRYGFMMRLGSVILKVESKCVADKIWFFPLLRPFIDHVPVRADLSDLADKIRWCRANDEACRAIAAEAQRLWDSFVAKDGLLDYVQLVTHRIAERFSYPAQPFLQTTEDRLRAAACPRYRAALPPKIADPAQACFQDDLCARCSADLDDQRRLTLLRSARDRALRAGPSSSSAGPTPPFLQAASRGGGGGGDDPTKRKTSSDLRSMMKRRKQQQQKK